MRKFSVVVPVAERDLQHIPRTLPSWLSLGSNDVVLCVDKPTSQQLVKTITKTATICKAGNVRTLEVERNPKWKFHQAFVRRRGFLEARNDIILTGDADLIVNQNVLKSTEMVGKNGIGLVSLSKFRYPRSPTDLWTTFVTAFLRKIVHGLTDQLMATTTFTGLYALWRRAWLDTEPESEAQEMVNPKQLYRGEKLGWNLDNFVMGEDTLLRDCIVRDGRYRVVYLRDVGAVDVGVELESRPFIQYMIGQYFAKQGRHFLVSLGRAVLRAQPYYLKGYLSQK